MISRMGELLTSSACCLLPTHHQPHDPKDHTQLFVSQIRRDAPDFLDFSLHNTTVLRLCIVAKHQHLDITILQTDNHPSLESKEPLNLPFVNIKSKSHPADHQSPVRTAPVLVVVLAGKACSVPQMVNWHRKPY